MPLDDASPEQSVLRSAKDLPTLVKIATGDASAFQRLYDRHSATLFGIVLRIVRDEAIAEEVLQDAFIQVWETADSWSEVRGSELAWLIVIARSRALDTVRNRRTRGDYETAASLEPVSWSRRPSDPYESIAAKRDRTAILKAMSEIPAEQSEAVTLAFFHQLTHREVARRLSLPLGTIKTRIKLGIEKISRSIRRQDAGDL